MFYRVSLCWNILSSSPGLWVWGGDPRSTEPSSHHMGPMPSTRLISMMPTLVASQVVSVGCLHWEPPSFLPSPHHVFSLKESLVRPPLQGSSRVGCCPVRWVLLPGDLSLVPMLFIQSSIGVDSCVRVHLFWYLGCLSSVSRTLNILGIGDISEREAEFSKYHCIEFR